MKIYRLPQLADSSPDGTFCMPPLNGDGALYLVYIRVRPGEGPRKLSNPNPSEEILFVLSGSVRVKCGKSLFSVGTGEAFHCKEPGSILIENPGKDEAVIITAGSTAAKQAIEAAEQAPKPSLEAVHPAKEEPEFVITRDDSPEDDDEAGTDGDGA